MEVMMPRYSNLISTLAVAILISAVATQARAASFNCDYAKSPTEVAICQDTDLQALDETMATDYFALTQALPYSARAKLKRSQSSFIARRNSCGYNSDCINSAYESRIARICSIAEDYDLSCDDF
jgi:uncharacterized protein